MKQHNQKPLTRREQKILEELLSRANSEDVPASYTEDEGKVIIGGLLKRLRKEQDLPQVEMAKRLKYGAQFLSMIERGSSKIPLEKVVDFAREYSEDVKLRSAIIRLLYHDIWEEMYWHIEYAGGDAAGYDYEVYCWIEDNK
jgi:transcriptional regulator with XRE-family HTH domain